MNHIIDLGPEAGHNGGEIVAQGSYKELLAVVVLQVNIYLINILYLY